MLFWKWRTYAEFVYVQWVQGGSWLLVYLVSRGCYRPSLAQPEIGRWEEYPSIVT